MFLEWRATVYYSAPVKMYVACARECVCVCCCKQALFMKWRWSTESCSHFKHHLFISPLWGTCTHSHTHPRWQKFFSSFHHAPVINLIPSPYSYAPSLNPSLPWNRWSVLSPNAAFRAIFIWRKKLISHSMNFHILHSAVIGKWRATGL